MVGTNGKLIKWWNALPRDRVPSTKSWLPSLYSTGMVGTKLGAALPGSNPSLCHTLAVPQASYLISVYFNFPTCKIGIILSNLRGMLWGSNWATPRNCLEQHLAYRSILCICYYQHHLRLNWQKKGENTTPLLRALYTTPTSCGPAPPTRREAQSPQTVTRERDTDRRPRVKIRIFHWSRIVWVSKFTRLFCRANIFSC